MKSLRRFMIWGLFILIVISILCVFADPRATPALLYLSTVTFSILELLVGTIYVERDTWVVMEDHATPGHDPYRWLQSQDPNYTDASEWGDRQLIPRWNDFKTPPPSPQPYDVTLIDLRTGVFTKAVVTSRPNDMVILAVHGSGITSMLLDRDAKALKSTIASKVGMANLPPFALAQAEDSGTVYVGGGLTAGTVSQAQPVPHFPQYASTHGSSDPEKLSNPSIIHPSVPQFPQHTPTYRSNDSEKLSNNSLPRGNYSY